MLGENNQLKEEDEGGFISFFLYFSRASGRELYPTLASRGGEKYIYFS